MARPTSEKFSAATVFHAKIQMLFRLEGMIQRHNEWMITRSKNLLLCQSTLDLVPLYHLLFAQNYRAKGVTNVSGNSHIPRQTGIYQPFIA